MLRSMVARKLLYHAKIWDVIVVRSYAYWYSVILALSHGHNEIVLLSSCAIIASSELFAQVQLACACRHGWNDDLVNFAL